MQVICLEDKAFFALIDAVVARLADKHGEVKDKWVSDEQGDAVAQYQVKDDLAETTRRGKDQVFATAEEDHPIRPGFNQCLSRTERP